MLYFGTRTQEVNLINKYVNSSILVCEAKYKIISY